MRIAVHTFFRAWDVYLSLIHISFAKARERAVAAVYGEETALLLQKPNNILDVYKRQCLRTLQMFHDKEDTQHQKGNAGKGKQKDAVLFFHAKFSNL